MTDAAVLTLAEVLEVLRISRSGWYRLVRAGVAPVAPVPWRRNGFARQDVLRALAGNIGRGRRPVKVSRSGQH